MASSKGCNKESRLLGLKNVHEFLDHKTLKMKNKYLSVERNGQYTNLKVYAIQMNKAHVDQPAIAKW